MDPISNTTKTAAAPIEGERRRSRLGSGSEIDRYEEHFAGVGERVKTGFSNWIHAKGTGAEQDRHESHFGLGEDGMEKVRRLSQTKGDGSEVDRYGAHFSMNRKAMDQATQSIQDATKGAFNKK